MTKDLDKLATTLARLSIIDAAAATRAVICTHTPLVDVEEPADFQYQ